MPTASFSENLIEATFAASCHFSQVSFRPPLSWTLQLGISGAFRHAHNPQSRLYPYPPHRLET